MNILLVNNFVRYGSGVDGVVRLQRDTLRERGHHVFEFGRDNRAFDEVEGYRRLLLLASCLYSFRARDELARLIEPDQVGAPAADLVYVHNTVPLLTGALWDARGLQRVATVQHLHNYRAFCLSSYAYRNHDYCDLCRHTGFASSVVFRCYRQSAAQSAILTASRWVDSLRDRPTGAHPDLYIANSVFTRERHIDHGVPGERIETLLNPSADLGVSVRREDSTEGAAAHGFAKGDGSDPAQRLTFVGSLISPKGPFVVLDVADALPEFSVRLIGEGSEARELRREAQRRRLGNVEFAGFLDGPELVDAWADSFLTLVPSLWDEPFGLVVPESYSLGIPVVTSGRGGLSETVRDGETGFIRDFSAANEIASEIRALWRDQDRYRAMRLAARAAYEQSFTKEAFACQLEALLETAVEKKRVASSPAGAPAKSPASDARRRPWRRPRSLDVRVLIDGHMLGAHETGNETYVRGLLHGFESIGCRQLVAVRRAGTDVGQHTAVVLTRHSDWARVFVDLPSLARQTQASVVHSTYILPPHLPCARVVTIHDLSFIRHPDMFTWRDRALLEAGVPLAVRAADQIIVPSEHARDDLVEVFGVAPQRVSVTHEGVDERFRPHTPQETDGPLRRYGIDFPYVLTVGNLQPRKNPRRLLAAWATLVAHGESGGCKLVLAGGSHGRAEDVAAEIARLRLGDHAMLTGYVLDDDLPALYSGARAFVFPSLYEGFGLPILEAMASGVPVACSNVTSMPEVAGEAAALFSPTEVDDIAANLAVLIGDEAVRTSLTQRGIERARSFSWETCARATLQVYRRAAERRDNLRGETGHDGGRTPFRRSTA